MEMENTLNVVSIHFSHFSELTSVPIASNFAFHAIYLFVYISLVLCHPPSHGVDLIGNNSAARCLIVVRGF